MGLLVSNMWRVLHHEATAIARLADAHRNNRMAEEFLEQDSVVRTSTSATFGGPARDTTAQSIVDDDECELKSANESEQGYPPPDELIIHSEYELQMTFGSHGGPPAQFLAVLCALGYRVLGLGFDILDEEHAFVVIGADIHCLPWKRNDWQPGDMEKNGQPIWGSREQSDPEPLRPQDEAA